MDRLRRAAILTQLVERLRRKGSWCGETHLQKATFFLQDLMEVPFGFDFILYKHGPFSFDLRDELTALRADELVKLEPQRPYGPRIVATDRSKYIQGIYSKTLEKYDDRISFVAEKVGTKGVADLERLTTALYVTQRAGIGTSIDERAAKLTALKPHIGRDDALGAVVEVDRIVEETTGLAELRRFEGCEAAKRLIYHGCTSKGLHYAGLAGSAAAGVILGGG